MESNAFFGGDSQTKIMDYENRKLIETFFINARITDELCASSITKYRDSIKKFLSVCGNNKIADIKDGDFKLFVLRMKDNGASNSRISNIIAAVKGLIGYLQRERLIGLKVNLDNIRKPKIPRREVNHLTVEEIKMFLETIKKDLEAGEMVRKVRMMALVMILLQTGARIGEALSVKVKDIDRINMEIPIIGKGAKPRSLYLSSYTLYWIDRYLSIRNSNHDLLFLTLDGKSKWSQTDVGRGFRRYRGKSGITKHFVLHTLRHTTATQLSDKGVPMNCIQHILGHSRLETTIKYYIGAAEKSRAKDVMRDDYYRFIPKEMLG